MQVAYLLLHHLQRKTSGLCKKAAERTGHSKVKLMIYHQEQLTEINMIYEVW